MILLKLLLCPPLNLLLLSNAMLRHSEPKTNYTSDLKPWEATVTDLYKVPLTLVPLTI